MKRIANIYHKRPLKGLLVAEQTLLLCVCVHGGKEELIDLLLEPARLIFRLINDVKEVILEV